MDAHVDAYYEDLEYKRIEDYLAASWEAHELECEEAARLAVSLSNNEPSARPFGHF